MVHSFLLFGFLMLAWLLLSGHYTPLIIGLGVASVLFAVLMARRVGASDDEGLPLYLIPGLPKYFVWLIIQILLSNWATIRLIFSRAISPCIARVDTKGMTTAALVLYANSITLTPGTVTIEVEEDGFMVHALTADMLAEVKGGDMAARIRRIDKRRREV